ncbi:hypothetical protein N752_26925 [Desulforamulus aquiferis]|nr:hypothetical protein N752_26925 [Desulforamulus aquiferis]
MKWGTLFLLTGVYPGRRLRVGRYVSIEKQKTGIESIRGEIDLYPSTNQEEIARRLGQIALEENKKILKTALATVVPERLALVLAELAGVSPQVTVGAIQKETWRRLALLLKGLPVNIEGTRSIDEATVTGGGIAVKEVDPRSMESKLIKGLFFAGEILDIDAHTGGFNMQVAFSTGYVAGEAAAKHALESID